MERLSAQRTKGREGKRIFALTSNGESSEKQAAGKNRVYQTDDDEGL